MKRVVLIVCAVVLCILLLTIVVSAHSGKTDSNGGHYNHSTGEYHYHHGYPAHQHYDINGDGVIDCPYKFDDQTNHNNTSSNIHTNSDQSNELTLSKIILIVLKIIGISLLVLLLGCSVIYIAYDLLLMPIGLWFCKKILKVNVNESTIGIVLITIIVVIVITIISVAVLTSEGLL
jgi:hypothetical protein